MQATGLPPVQVSQDSWEYQTIPGLSRDASHRATPSPSIPGFLGIPNNPGIIPGCKPQGYPQSKYPRIPNNPGMQATGTPPAPSICLSVCVCLSAVIPRCLGIILGYSIVVLENMNTTKLVCSYMYIIHVCIAIIRNVCYKLVYNSVPICHEYY